MDRPVPILPEQPKRIRNIGFFSCFIIVQALLDRDPGLTGNLLVERFVGAHIELVSIEEFIKSGSVKLTELLKSRLIKEGRKPYVIPAGGSNSPGTWGYIEAIREIEQQTQAECGDFKFDDIVVACGSGGTAAGLSLGSKLSGLQANVHAFSVSYDPCDLYKKVQGLIDGLEAGVNSHDIVNIEDARGLGYSRNTVEELKFVQGIARTTGVVLDPVYSGKAAYAMLKDMTENPSKWKGRKILFIHTGGLLGLYDKIEQMGATLGNWRKMDIDYDDIPREDGIGKMF